jgi:hypothetical protein
MVAILAGSVELVWGGCLALEVLIIFGYGVWGLVVSVECGVKGEAG